MISLNLGIFEKNRRRMIKTSVPFGIYAGFACIALNLLLFITGLDTFPMLRNLNYISLVFLAIGVFYGIRTFRISRGETLSSFKLLLGAGLLVSFITACMQGIFSYYYFGQIHPELTSQIISHKIQLMREVGISPEKITRQERWLDIEYSPKGQGIFSIIAFMVLGLVFSVIFGFLEAEEESEEDPVYPMKDPQDHGK